jgi:hypothetical protein
VGSSHHSGGGGGGGGAHRSGGGSGGSYSGGGGGYAHPRSGAELRHPRAGTGTGYRYYHGYGHHHGYYGYPYYYSPYYYGYWPYWGSYWGWPYYNGGYYGYGYGYGGGYGGEGGPSYGYGGDESGAVRTFVEPSETKIYVDGRLAGTADDFDGLMERLYLSPGAHELTLSLEGYKTHRVKLYLAPGATLKLHYDMVKGSGEDAQIDTLGNPEDERYGHRDRRYDDEAEEGYNDEVRRHDDRGAPPREPDDEARPPRDHERPTAGLTWGNELGTVHLSIEPGDASVYVDGRFRGPANGLRALRLSPGKHHIEVVRPGFGTVERDVDVMNGEETNLELELSRSSVS